MTANIEQLPQGPLDVWQRRGLLDAVKNPDRSLDYVAVLEWQAAVASLNADARIVVRYVPDTLIIKPDHFRRYLDAMVALDWTSLEHLASTILGDVSNETVARWTQLLCATEPGGAMEADGTMGHQVLLEDRQPGWENEALLSRLKPL